MAVGQAASVEWAAPEHDRTRELRAQLPEAGWRAAMGAIARRHGLELDGLAPFASGSDVVWGAAGWVAKLTAPMWREEIAAEARLLAHVRGRLPVATPAPLATGELDGWPYVVMSRVPGVALGERWPGLPRAERLRLAAELGELVAALHALPLPAGADDWERFWRGCTTDVEARHARHASREAPRELVGQIAPFLEARGPLASDARALLHTELLGDHILVEERGGRLALAALIDFADGRVGPPEYEHAAPVEFLFRGEPGLLSAYLAAQGQEAGGSEAAERRLAWALCHRFGSLARMLRAVAPARPASLRELARLLFAG